MPRGAKGGKKRSRKEASDNIVEDLDLDIGDAGAYVNDDDVVHNRCSRKATREDGVEEEDMFAVLPSDAHRLDGYGDDENGGFQEEEELAVVTEKGLRKKTTEEDFDVAGVSVAHLSSRRDDVAKKSSLDALDAAPVIEAVERDFAALTTAERLAVLKKESPELLRLLLDLKTYMAEVKTLAQPLHELLYERKVSPSDKNLVSFLETKVQLMLSYCMHVTFYLLLKSEGRKVAGHPVIDHLVEIRVYLEKMWPLEEKLQYSLNRLISGKSTAAAHLNELRPLQSGEGGAFESSRAMQNTEARERRQQLRHMKEAEELERKEQAAMTRVRTKKASALNNSNTASSAIAPVSYQEDEDQFFSRIAGGADKDGGGADEVEGEEGLSLMEVLRRRQKKAGDVLSRQRTSKQPSKPAAVDSDDGDDEDDLNGMGDMDGDEDEMDLGGADDGDDCSDGDYEAVWEEERARQAAESSRKAAAAAAASARRPAQEEVDRRKVGKKIESHRGLTRARPKDRKNPRVAQRRKYERGMQVQKSQSRSFQPKPEGEFVGVRDMRPGVVRGTKL